MKLSDVLQQLDASSAGRSRILMGPLRALGKKIKTDHPLALALWATGRTDAMILATMVMDPNELTAKEVAAMLAPLTDFQLVDELTYNAVADAPCADALSRKWIGARKELTGRAGWNLLVGKLLAKRMTAAESDGLLRTIEAGMKSTPVKAAESMMRCLVEIAVRFPEHRERAIDIGTRWGRIDDRPVAKGCTPFYAPAWIAAILKRQR